MAEDLISLFCKGKSGGVPRKCNDFIPLTKECRLLKDQKMAMVFEKGRCIPYKMVERAVKGNLKLYEHLLSPQDSIEHYLPALTFEIAERIKARQLKQRWTIYFLKGYINRAVYHEVIRRLEDDGIVLKGICGNCIHLSRSKQYTCERETIISIEQGGEVENPYYGKIRKQSDSSCKEGFEPYTIENINNGIQLKAIESPSATPKLLEAIKTLLSKRAIHETRKKRKRIYQRQYAVFCDLKHLLVQGMLRREAIEEIAAELGESIKTIYFDIQDIKNFLAKKNVI
jgi:hypothetical protein